MENPKLTEFSLARPLSQRQRSQKPRGAKVTIAIGIVSKRSRWGPGEIILASDSQMTFADGPKDLDAEKLSIVRFQNGRLLMVHAGYVQPAKKAVRTIQHLAKTERIENAERVIEKGMREVRKALLDGFDFSDERKKTYLQLDQKHEFLIAYYLNGEPFLRCADNYSCVVFPLENDKCGAIGLGKELGHYLLKEHQASDGDFEFSDLAAISVIERVKANVDGCAGPCQVGMVVPMANEWECDVSIFPRPLVENTAHAINNFESNILSDRKSQLNKFQVEFWKQQGMMIYGKFAEDNPMLKQMFE
ncbi:MAG TPA: hypothetical protein VKV04_03310 [Verrucomicrobiae bacterium]|nr:hypothetical protein [Verrucomicrobiae bacterium]